ncbi:hypothetical protein O9992_07570 [Vibrio lentus]|nr:hypothetical protein [Vibrio lentus]
MNWARKFLTDNRRAPCPHLKQRDFAGEQIWVRHEAITGDEVSRANRRSNDGN